MAQRLDFDRTPTDTADHLAPSLISWLQAVAAGPSSDASTAGAPQGVGAAISETRAGSLVVRLVRGFSRKVA